MTGARTCRACGEGLKPGYYHNHDKARADLARAARHGYVCQVDGVPYRLVLCAETGATVLAPVQP